MKLKLFTILFLLPCLLYLFGCNSSPYNISEDTSDTVGISNNLDTANAMTLSELNQKYPKKDYRIRSAPKFTLQINAGYDYGLAELNSNYQIVYQASEFESGQNFGARKGFGMLAVGKIPFSPKSNFRITFLGAFNYFFNSAMSSRKDPNGKVKYQVYSAGVGLENSFTPSYRVKPYFGAAVLVNLIGGSAEYINDTNAQVNIKFKPSFRIGLNISTGIEYLLDKNMGLNFGVNLTSANLLLKSSGTSSDPNNIPIRDKRISPFLPFSGYKQFLYTSFYVGVNFYFGIKEKAFHL